MPRGRKPKLTAKTQEKICAALRSGNYRFVAAQYAGIHTATLYTWLAKGEQQDTGIYHDFVDAVQKAEAEAEMAALVCIRQKMPEEWQAAAWYLERKYPAKWSRRVELIQKQDDSGRASTAAAEFIRKDPDAAHLATQLLERISAGSRIAGGTGLVRDTEPAERNPMGHGTPPGDAQSATP